MKKMHILYEDKEILIIDKPSGLLTIGTEKIKEHTLYHEAREYIKKINPKQKIFIVHRLDKDTSGIVVFAKSEKSKMYLQDNWETFTRIYYAIVTGKPKEHDVIKNYLAENKAFMVYETTDKRVGKLAITEYTKLQSKGKYHLLEVNIKTGRKNQIRVHLLNNETPIVGDRKYNNDHGKRLMLHAGKIVIKHPITHQELLVETKLPKDFNYYI